MTLQTMTVKNSRGVRRRIVMRLTTAVKNLLSTPTRENVKYKRRLSGTILGRRKQGSNLTS
jgi:hypothetical protein